jgi:hypothetical protein
MGVFAAILAVAPFSRTSCSSRADSGGFEFRPGDESAETPRSGPVLCAMPAPSDSLKVRHVYGYTTQPRAAMYPAMQQFVGMPVICVGCAGGSRVNWLHLANVQVHPTSSSAVSERSSLAAFGSEAESPAGLDKQTVVAPASQGGHSNGASAVSEITPADDTELADSSGSKMRQLSPELAADGRPYHMSRETYARPCCLSKMACLPEPPHSPVMVNSTAWLHVQVLCRVSHGYQPTPRLQRPGSSGCQNTRACSQPAALPPWWLGLSCCSLGAGGRPCMCGGQHR